MQPWQHSVTTHLQLWLPEDHATTLPRSKAMSYKSKRPKITTTVELNLGSLWLLATPHEGHFPKPLARTSVLQMPWEMLKMQPAVWQVHLAYSIFLETPHVCQDSREQQSGPQSLNPREVHTGHQNHRPKEERGSPSWAPTAWQGGRKLPSFSITLAEGE